MGGTITDEQRLKWFEEAINFDVSATRQIGVEHLIELMSSDQPREEVVAMRTIQRILESHPDTELVVQGAIGLVKRGDVALQYIAHAAANSPKTTSRGQLLSKLNAAAEKVPASWNLDWDKMIDQAQAVLIEARTDCITHGFSRTFKGLLNLHDNSFLRYVFQICAGTEALMSFSHMLQVEPEGYQWTDAQVEDEACLPIVRAFAQDCSYEERQGWSNIPSCRYFTWTVNTTSVKKS